MRFVVIFPLLVPNKDDCPFSASLSILFPSGSFIFHGGISLVACYSCRKQGVTHTKSLHYLAMVHLYTAEPENCRPCWCCTGNREAGTRNKHAEAFVLFQTEEKTIDVGGKKMGHISCSTDLDVAFCFCFLSLFRRPVMFLFFSVLAIFRKPAVITYTKSWSPPFVLSPSLSSLLKNLMMP